MPSPSHAAALKRWIEAAVAEQREPAVAAMRAIHGYAEPPMAEFASSRCVADYLGARGFDVDFAFPNLPTAFRAVWGSRKPTIGMLGEYDALPDCGERDGEWGHGCGHELLGMAAAVGAAAAKAALQRAAMPGRIVFYGCPAEETVTGKVYMARDGAFRDLDACLSWHPGYSTNVNRAGGAAVDTFWVEFFGQAAHAAGCPQQGRSALDAAMLFDVAVNYLREHVPDNVRIHGVILDGGTAPNVVPPYARCWYTVRGLDREQVGAVHRRVGLCARAAAMATETRVRETLLSAIYNRLPNDALGDLLGRNLKRFGPPRADSADIEAAKALGIEPVFAEDIGPDSKTPERASTDDDNVSWLAPLGSFRMACRAKNTPGHNRIVTKQNLLPYGLKGAFQAAKVFAGAAVDLIADKQALRAVRQEFARRTQGFEYDPIVSPKQKVPKAWP